jgi:hypothetical protein
MRRDRLPPGVQCESALENAIRAQAASQAEAWHRAVEQAEAVGMVGGRG